VIEREDVAYYRLLLWLESIHTAVIGGSWKEAQEERRKTVDGLVNGFTAADEYYFWAGLHATYIVLIAEIVLIGVGLKYRSGSTSKTAKSCSASSFAWRSVSGQRC
jgi:hypothetical protein